MTRVPRAQNAQANALAKLASGSNVEPPPEVEQLPYRTIATKEVITIDPTPTWMEEILRYKRDGTLPTDTIASR